MTSMTTNGLEDYWQTGKSRAVIRHHVLEEGSKLLSTIRVLAKRLLQQRDGATSYEDHATRIL
jgi:hypothetical protein